MSLIALTHHSGAAFLSCGLTSQETPAYRKSLRNRVFVCELSWKKRCTKENNSSGTGCLNCHEPRRPGDGKPTKASYTVVDRNAHAHRQIPSASRRNDSSMAAWSAE